MTIDISDIAQGQEDEYLRHLSDLTSCPCYNCTRICINTEDCTAYNLWQERKWEERERRGRGSKNHKRNKR